MRSRHDADPVTDRSLESAKIHRAGQKVDHAASIEWHGHFAQVACALGHSADLTISASLLSTLT